MILDNQVIKVTRDLQEIWAQSKYKVNQIKRKLLWE